MPHWGLLHRSALPEEVEHALRKNRTNPTNPSSAITPPIIGHEGKRVASDAPESKSNGIPQQTKCNRANAIIVVAIGGFAAKSV